MASDVRVASLNVTSEIFPDDSILVDSEQNGTRRVPYSVIRNEVNRAEKAANKAETSAQGITNVLSDAEKIKNDIEQVASEAESYAQRAENALESINSVIENVPTDENIDKKVQETLDSRLLDYTTDEKLAQELKGYAKTSDLNDYVKTSDIAEITDEEIKTMVDDVWAKVWSTEGT